ncbi:hypothetical protein B0H13DRAFT_2310347 [Mycena leptocephala]|nr:hypothetical protein B0H13DRAFT_2310347 [Mycena leptocephala]
MICSKLGIVYGASSIPFPSRPGVYSSSTISSSPLRLRLLLSLRTTVLIHPFTAHLHAKKLCTFAAHSTRFATLQRRLDRACHAVFLFLLPASATFLALALGLTPAGKAGFSSPLELLFFFSRGRVRVARPLPPSFTQPFMPAIVRSGAGCGESATLTPLKADAARLSCHLLLWWGSTTGTIGWRSSMSTIQDGTGGITIAYTGRFRL